MEVTYSGATTEQQQAVEAAFGSLLNLPESAIPLTLSVEFVADPLPDPGNPHREFGYTEFSYGSTTATIRIRNDAPTWPSPYDGIQALNEVAVHELGHALFAALSEEKRTAIAQMFGADSDELAELQPEGVAWEDLIIEGIAETFKDAFLPASLRKSPVHTNIKLSISRYPEFRALFREGTESIGTTPDFDHDVLELDYHDLGDAWINETFFDQAFSNTYYTVYRAGYDLFEREMLGAHSFEYSFSVPNFLPNPMSLEEPPHLFSWRYLVKVNGVTVANFRGVWAWAGVIMINQERQFFHNEYYYPDSVKWDDEGDRPPQSDITWNNSGVDDGDYILYEDAIGVGAPPAVVGHTVEVEPGDLVTIHARALGMRFTTPGGANFEEEAKERMGPLLAFADDLPTMGFKAGGALPGQPIEVPSAAVQSGGFDGGRVLSVNQIRG